MESSGRLHIRDEGIDDAIHLLELEGELDLYTAPEFRQRLVELIESGRKQIVVDLSKATFTDETNLGVLVEGVKRLRPAGGSLVLVLAAENITSIFEITGLDRVFPIHSSREEALAALGVDVGLGSLLGPARLTHEQLLAASAADGDAIVYFTTAGAYESAVISGVTYGPVPPGTYSHDEPDWIRADCESREDAEARAAHTMDELKRALGESAAEECPPGMDEREVEQRLYALAKAISPDGEFPSAKWLRDARSAYLAFPEP